MPFGHSFDDIYENYLAHPLEFISDGSVGDRLQVSTGGLVSSSQSFPRSTEHFGGFVKVDNLEKVANHNLSAASTTNLCENSETRLGFQCDSSADVCTGSEHQNSCDGLAGSDGTETKVDPGLNKHNTDKNNLFLDIPVADFMCKGKERTDDHESFLKVLEGLKNAVSVGEHSVEYSTESSKQESEVPITQESLLLSVCEQNNLSKNLTTYDIHQADSDSNSVDLSHTFITYIGEIDTELPTSSDHVANLSINNSTEYGDKFDDEINERQCSARDFISEPVSVSTDDLNKPEANSVYIESKEIYVDYDDTEDAESCADTGDDEDVLVIDLKYTGSSESCSRYICNGKTSENITERNLINTGNDSDNKDKIRFITEGQDLIYSGKNILIKKGHNIDLNCPSTSEKDLDNSSTENIYEDDLNHAVTQNVNPIKSDCKVIDLTKTFNGVESPERSESPEPGTTHVTISDRIKSLILLKLLSMSTAPQSKSDTDDNNSKKYNSNITENSESKKSKRVSYCCKQMAAMAAHAHQSNQATGVGVKSSIAATSSYSIPVIVLGTQQTSDNSNAVTITTNSSHISLTPVAPTVVQSAGSTFTCELCPYFTNNKNYLKQHVDIVHNTDRPYKCPFCGYAGKRSHALREHLIVHSSERPYECKDCNATFRKKGHLTNHIKLHNRKRLVSCPLCKSLVFDQGEQGLDVHLKTTHGTEKLYGCDLCNFIAGNEPEIVKHLNETHLKVNVFKCVKCAFETSDWSSFESHVKNHNLKLQQTDNGNIEKQTFRSFSHMPVSSSQNSAATASSTGSSVTKSTFRNVAEVGQPAVVKPVWIKCTECGFMAQDSEVIRQHMLKHVQVNEQAFSNEQPKQTAILTSVANNISQQRNQGMDCNMQINVPCSSLPIPNIPVPVHRLQAGLSSIPSPIKQTLTVPGKASIPIVTSPILVPITDLKQLTPQAANLLDLNSPILVPVSDAAMLKDVPVVKMSSFQYSPTKAPAKYIRVASTDTDGSGNMSLVPVIQRSPYIEMNQTAKTSPQDIVLSHTISEVMNQRLLQTSTRNSDELPVLPDSTVMPDDDANLSDLEEHSLKIVCDMDSNKIVGSSKLETVGSSNYGPVSTSSEPTSQNIHVDRSESQKSNEETVSAGNTASRSVTSTTGLQSFNNNMVNHFRLTEIPIPRNVSTDPPKLPPEILRMSEDQHKGALGGQSVNEEDDKVATLRASLKNVQQLIQQQEKLQKQLGNEGKYLDAKGIPEKAGAKNIVYYITPTSKQNTVQNGANVGFTHDSTAGRFRCTICGYTCEYQRTIKAHIWKHSGNKDIDYPMFQNGPLSIYEEEQLPEDNPSICETIDEHTVEVCQSKQQKPIPVCVESTEEKSPSKGEENMPPFIIYEEAKIKISPVAPALAHLIAARTMVGLCKDSKDINKDNVEHKRTSEDSYQMRNTSTKYSELKQTDLQLHAKKWHLSQDSNENSKPIIKKPKIDLTQSVNVVVESVNSVGNNSIFTGMSSLQNSPKLSAPRSPEETDSGVSVVTTSNVSKTSEESVSSKILSAESDSNLIIDETNEVATQSKTSERRLCSLEMEHMYSRNNESHMRPSTPEEAPVSRKRKISEMSDQAVTLLSLLKKGPNFNPACPPRNVGSSHWQTDTQYEDTPSLSQDTPSLSQDDVTSTEETDISGEKPKSGISTSLLAVIEQLRERSKSDVDEDKAPSQPALTKKQSKRRSRKSSVEENESALGISNVEEFVAEGEVKFRCKLCHYANESTVLLRQHMRLHKTKQPFECSLCDFIGESSEALQDHMIQHCKVRTYQCKLCPSAFNYKSQLRAHMRAHNDQDILMCDFCDFETRNQIALKTHMKSHLTNPPYKCEFCREEFITSFNLRLHKREGCNTSIDRFGNYKCDECDFTSLGRREMKNHQRGHSQSKAINQNSKQCPYCKYMAAAVEEIQQHIMDKHGDSKPMKCEMCGFVAVSIRSLKSHMKRHVNDQRFVQQPLEQYKCNLCGYVCHHLPSLKSHMWRHAADQHYSYEFTNEVINAAIDFDCTIEASDTTDEDVEEFRKLIYEKMIAKGLENTRETKEKSAYACCWVTFRCCQCGFETINKAELNRHMNEHSDIIKMTLQVSKKTCKKVGLEEETVNDAKQC